MRSRPQTSVRAELVEARARNTPPSAGWQSQPLRTGFDKLRANGVVVASLAALLAGCTTVGPDYHRPADAIAEKPTATAPFVSGADPAFAPAPLPDRWWRLYDDPTLDRLVADALAHNTDLRVASATIARAQAALKVAQANGGRRLRFAAGPAACLASVSTLPLDAPRAPFQARPHTARMRPASFDARVGAGGAAGLAHTRRGVCRRNGIAAANRYGCYGSAGAISAGSSFWGLLTLALTGWASSHSEGQGARSGRSASGSVTAGSSQKS